MRTSARAATAVLAAAAALTACGGSGNAGSGNAAAPGAVSEAAATSSAAVSVADLRDGLLPATAFGEDATVVGLSLEQLGDLPALAGLPQGATVQPSLCGKALTMLSKAAPGSGDGVLPALVAEGSFSDDVRTLEVLADGPALDGLDLPVDRLLAGCSTVTVTGTDGAVTTVDLAALDVPDLGAAATGLQVTVTGPQGSAAALLGVVSAGQRAVVLAQTGADGATPDPAAFSALLTQAAAAAQ